MNAPCPIFSIQFDKMQTFLFMKIRYRGPILKLCDWWSKLSFYTITTIITILEMFYDLAHLGLHPTLIYISWTKLCICDCSAVCISDRQNTKLEIRALFAAMLNCNIWPNNCDTNQIMVIPLTWDCKYHCEEKQVKLC